MLDNHEHKHAVHEFDGIIENRVSKPPVYFTVLFYGLIIWGVAFMSFYLLSGWSSQAEFQEKMAAHKGEQPAQQQAATATPAPEAAPATPGADSGSSGGRCSETARRSSRRIVLAAMAPMVKGLSAPTCQVNTNMAKPAWRYRKV